MAQVELRIGGRAHEIACRDGEEARLLELAAIVDEKMSAAGRALGGMNETRRLVVAAIMLADELAEARARAAAPPPPDPWAGIAPLMEEIAERLEAAAAKIDGGVEPDASDP
ncbi:MAG: cell division protein ZapA [Sphingomonas fennica]